MTLLYNVVVSLIVLLFSWPYLLLWLIPRLIGIFILITSIFVYIIETFISIMFEQTNVNNSASMDEDEEYRQLTIKSILSILSLGIAYYYLGSIRRPNNSHSNQTATTNTSSACNNPTCLRCHSNSQQHAASF